jgi:hypothetical protein
MATWNASRSRRAVRCRSVGGVKVVVFSSRKALAD